MDLFNTPNLNSQFSYHPPQPDNPSNADRHLLAEYALAQRGRQEDLPYILELTMPPPDITTLAKPGGYPHIRVAVLGGGLAGLAAAFELRKLGVEIAQFEALEDRVGGRVYTWYFNREQTLYGEFGPMRIPVTHETVWHYLKLFRLPTRPFIQVDPKAWIYLKNIRVRNDPDGRNVQRYIYPQYHLMPWERRTPWQKLLSLGVESHLLYATPAERAEILQVKPRYSPKTLIWSNSSSLEMMEAAGLSQEAIHLVSNFAPLLYGNLYNSYIDYIEEVYPVDLSYLYEVPGGFSRIPLAFYQSFFQPDQSDFYSGFDPVTLGKINWKGGWWVDGIRYHGDNKKVGILAHQVRSREVREELFDYVICAIPFSSLRNVKVEPLFSNFKMRAIREVNYSSSQKTLLLCSERFWEQQGINGGGSYTDLPVASVWYPSDHSNSKDGMAANEAVKPLWQQPGVLTASYNFNLDTTRLTNLPEDLHFRDIKRELELIHGLTPGYLDRAALEMKTVDWDQQPSFRGSLSFFAPQQKEIFSWGMALPEYEGRIFFAGEHISAIHRWMQGALQSGMQAANGLAVALRQNNG